MEYHEIGERFEYGRVTLEVVESTTCAGCFFLDHLLCILGDNPKYCGAKRSDKRRSISYKLVEQFKPKDMEQKTEIIVEGTGKVFATQVTNPQSDEEIYGSLLDKLFTTYKAKDADYGSSFAEMFDELGIDYAYGKLREKMN